MKRKTRETEHRRVLGNVSLHVPRVLQMIGEEAAKNGTDRLSSAEIDKIIRATRAARSARRKR